MLYKSFFHFINLLHFFYRIRKNSKKIKKLFIEVVILNTMVNITTEKNILEAKADVLVVGLFEQQPLSSMMQQLDDALNHEISNAITQKRFTGELKEICVLSTQGKMPAKQILLIGLGDKKEFTLETLRKVSGVAAKEAREMNAKSFANALLLVDFEGKDEKNEETKALAIAEATILGLYQFTHYKTVDKEKIKKIDSMILIGNNAEQISKGINKAMILTECTNLVRDLVNEPSNVVTPSHLAAIAEKMAKELPLKTQIFDKKQLEKLGMNAILAVTKGSAEEPKFIVLSYQNGKKSMAIVGKGITFDSGGLSLKPEEHMEDMKIDMAGAATVLATMKAAAMLKLPITLFGVIPTCENMPSGTAVKPGDIVTGFNGKTIEILNTDAEGRLVLSDALAYTEKELHPELAIDLATLTGAVIVALGSHAAGMMGTDQKNMDLLVEAGEETFERVWQLPLWDEYKENMKSDLADVRNISKIKEAGSITGAIFLQNFIDSMPWIHLDIAGTASLNDEREYLPKGGTGYGVRLLIKFMEKYVQ